MNSIEDFNNLEYNQDFNYTNDYDKYYYDKLSELISIPYIFLKYSKSIILIKSYCTNNHESILPLNEFLIKYHPLYKYYQNYQFCNKCWIKLIYGKKQLILILLINVMYVIYIFAHINQIIAIN